MGIPSLDIDGGDKIGDDFFRFRKDHPFPLGFLHKIRRTGEIYIPPASQLHLREDEPRAAEGRQEVDPLFLLINSNNFCGRWFACGPGKDQEISGPSALREKPIEGGNCDQNSY